MMFLHKWRPLISKEPLKERHIAEWRHSAGLLYKSDVLLSVSSGRFAVGK